MDEYIEQQCLILKDECIDYIDRLNFVKELTLDIISQWGGDEAIVRGKIINQLKKIYDIDN